MAVQIILKNSSVEDKRPQASQLTNGEISLNYSSAGAFLCCTDTNGDVQQVGGVKIDETAPDAPVKQTLWFKPSTLTLSVFDGDKWLPIAGGGGGGTPGGGDIIQIIGNDGIDADTVAGIVTLDVELAGGDDGLEFKSSKLSATLASATDLGSVKVGDNINVTAGKISVPKATSSTFGVVKIGDGIDIDGDGSISIDVPTTTVYRGSCDLNNPPTGQINPDPALKGDAYINSADAPAVDAGWTGITGSAKIGDLVIFDGTTWDLIPLGSGEAPVTSVNGKTGDVVLDYTDVGAASEAQGELADTALQPGDNITELNNDAGYITAAEAPVLSVNGKTGVVVLDAADVGALAPGDDVSELVNDAGYITLAELPDQEPPVIISATAPTGDDAVEGNLWFNSNDGRTYVYYKDGDSSQWVDASPDSGGAGGTVGDYWLEAGGYLSPKTGTNGVDIGGSKIQLNADGNINTQGLITSNRTGGFGSFAVSQNGTVNGYWYASGELQIGGTLGSEPNIRLSENGSSEFAGDMAIGTTGSFTPSTPAISLAADGNITTAGNVTSTTYEPNLDTAYGYKLNKNGFIGVQKQAGTNPSADVFAITTGDARVFDVLANGDTVSAGDIQSTSQNGSQLAGFRNQIINGDFGVWQRGLSTTITGQGYGPDRWEKVLAVAGEATLARVPSPFPGFAYACQATGTDVSTFRLRQGIELPEAGAQGHLTGTWTISFYADVPITNAGLSFADDMLNTNAVAWDASGPTQSLGNDRYSRTFTAPTAAATNICALLSIGAPSGPSFTITGVQLEPGPVATPFEHRPIGTELALCQRYYQKISHQFGLFYAFINGSPTTLDSQIMTLPVVMRAVPTASSSGGQYRVCTINGGNTGTGTVTRSLIITAQRYGEQVSAPNSMYWVRAQGTGFVPTERISIQVQIGTDLIFDAEL